ncbi:SUKH-4 family immunity protein [Streptomyces sp. NPDC093589]|uniref:SUKH-4 family immunity protein n=1 Tax=Streptomyces sp. NPDC093589 TaxID=3366043 RepID=UPI003810018B
MTDQFRDSPHHRRQAPPPVHFLEPLHAPVQAAIDAPAQRSAQDIPDRESFASQRRPHRSALPAAAKEPTAAWLESIFGAGSLWRPTDDELPAHLEDKEARRFLTTVGFPAVRLDFASVDTTDLFKEGMWEADPAELFGERYPDDDSPPERYAYRMGEQYGSYLMMMGDTGSISLYDPNGWDHAAGYDGYAARSLPELAGALGLLALHEDALTGADSRAALREFRTLMAEFDGDPEPTDLWENIFETLDEEYGDPDR